MLERKAKKALRVLLALGDGLGRTAIDRGIPPSWLGYRWVQQATIEEAVARANGAPGARYETIHPADRAERALPCNVADRDELPKDRGWWHYSFWDVPERRSDPTFIATLPDCTVVPLIDTSDNDIFNGDFWVGILTKEQRALDLREFHFRAQHAEVLREADRVVQHRRATWLTERVYHNYSHWLTAHLPKFLLLKERGQLSDVLFPASRPSFIDESLRMLGIDPDAFETFEPGIPLEIEELTLVGNDRFRPELLQSVRAACPIPAADEPDRRVYISRAQADRRQLINEREIWAVLRAAGFEKVFMEDLSFENQVRLMRETSLLVAPHGAGLTNMMFCPPGTHVVEIANLDFPNPNFYAVAAAMDHHYWLLSAEPVGDGHPLQKDLSIDPTSVEELLMQLV